MQYIIKQGSNNILFHRLQRQNLYMTFKRVPRWLVERKTRTRLDLFV